MKRRRTSCDCFARFARHGIAWCVAAASLVAPANAIDPQETSATVAQAMVQRLEQRLADAQALVAAARASDARAALAAQLSVADCLDALGLVDESREALADAEERCGELPLEERVSSLLQLHERQFLAALARRDAVQARAALAGMSRVGGLAIEPVTRAGELRVIASCGAAAKVLDPLAALETEWLGAAVDAIPPEAWKWLATAARELGDLAASERLLEGGAAAAEKALTLASAAVAVATTPTARENASDELAAWSSVAASFAVECAALAVDRGELVAARLRQRALLAEGGVDVGPGRPRVALAAVADPIELRRTQAEVATELGQFAEARDALCAARELARDVDMPALHGRLALAAARLALAQDRDAPALAELDAAAEWFAAGGAPTQGAACAIERYGVLRRRREPAANDSRERQRDEELTLLDGATELAEGAGDVVLTAIALANRGDCLWRHGDWAGAIPLSARAADDLIVAGQTDAAQAPLRTLARAAIEGGDAATARSALRCAIAEIDPSEVRAPSRIDAAERRRRAAEWGEVVEDLLTLELAAATSPERAAHLREEAFVAGARWQAPRLATRLEREGHASPVTLAALAAAVARDTSDATLLVLANGRSRLFGWSLAGDRLERIDLGDRAELEQLARAALATLRDPASGAQRCFTAAAPIAERVLRPLLGAALSPSPARADGVAAAPWRLLIIPTPEWAAFPFDAVPLARPAPVASAPLRFDQITWCVDRCEVIEVPSLRWLAWQPPVKNLELAPALVIAAPRAGTPGSREAQEEEIRFREDCREVAARSLGADPDPNEWRRFLALDEARDLPFESRNYHELRGAAATPDALAGDLTRFRLMHFACHGLSAGDDPRRHGLQLAGTEGRSLLSVPMVEELELSVDLAVLAACSTARGEPLAGEGLQSLGRAFLQAGARTVVASLWDVPANETPQVVQRFYSALYARPEEGAARALRTAKRMLAHPARARGVVPPDPAELPQPGDAPPPFLWAGLAVFGTP